MTNLCLNKKNESENRAFFTFKKQQGISLLLVAVILLVATTLIIIFAANYSLLQTKATANQYRTNQAFEAAEAGLDYALAYLQTNSTTVLANPSNGFINYTIPSTSLPNGSSFTVVIVNSTASNYNLLNITSTGTSVDGSTTDVINAQVQSGASSLQYAVTTQGSLTASGNVTISGSNGIDVGGIVTTNGNTNISNIVQNDTTLANLSSSALFSQIFGMSPATMEAQSTYYASGNNVPFNSLSGSVWIDSSVTHSGNITIGTQNNPVLIIVNGDFVFSGGATIYGILYVMGSVTVSGNFSLNGGLIAQGPIVASGSVATYNASIVKQLTAGGGFARVPGSWRDF